MLNPTPRDGGHGGDSSIIITCWINARDISGTPTSQTPARGVIVTGTIKQGWLNRENLKEDGQEGQEMTVNYF